MVREVLSRLAVAVSVDRLGEDIDTCLPGLTNQTGYRLRWFLRLVYSRATQGAKGVSFGVCLPKHHAEAGRGVEARHGAEE